MKIRPVGAELFHPCAWTDRQTGGHDEANSRHSKFCELAGEPKNRKLSCGDLSPRRTESRAAFLLSYRKGPGSNTDQNSQGCQPWQIFLFPRSFKATMKQRLLPHRLHIPFGSSLLDCPTTKRWMSVADERVSLNKPEIKQSGETHTTVEFLVDEINVVKKSSATWCRKVVSGFIMPMNEYYVCTATEEYQKVRKGHGISMPSTHKLACVVLLTAEVTNHKTWFIWRHELPSMGDPIPRCEQTNLLTWSDTKWGK